MNNTRAQRTEPRSFEHTPEGWRVSGGALMGGEALAHAHQAQQAQEKMLLEKCSAANLAPQGQREIPFKIGKLFTATEVLSEKIARLGQRLGGVLVLQPEQAQTVSEIPYETELGAMLAQLVARVALMIDAVDSMDARLEL